MSLLESWGVVFSQSVLGLWYQFITFVPSLLGAVIIFIVGLIVAYFLGKAVTQIISVLKIDKLFESAGANNFIQKTGFKLSISRFLGGIVRWFTIIVFLMASLQIIGLTQVNEFLNEAVLYYLPNVIVAFLVLVIATILADAMKKLVISSSKAANISSANMLGSITSYAIWIFAFVVALSELGIADTFMQILFAGLVVAFAIAFGLAFGLGGKEAASRAIEKISNDMK